MVVSRRMSWVTFVLLAYQWTTTEGVCDNLSLVSYAVEVNINCSVCGSWKSTGQHTKLSTRPVASYANSTAVRRILLLAGDIQVNPGPVRAGRSNQADESRGDQKDDYLRDFIKAMSVGSKNLNIALINIRSLRNKVEEVRILLSVCRFDILSITETHLDKTISDGQLEVENYKIVRRDRRTQTNGGGCMVYVANRMRTLESEQVEGIWLKVLIDSSVFIVGTIYRPQEIYDFFEPFHQTLEQLWLKYKNVVFVGDFNCDFLSVKETSSSLFWAESCKSPYVSSTTLS